MKLSSDIIVGIPCLFGSEHTRQAIESVINDANVLLIDNGASQDVKDVIEEYSDRCFVIRNIENVYVNPAWNQIMHFFLAGGWLKLVIMNSDLIMHKGWSKCIWGDVIPIPGNEETTKIVTEGTPGVFICLDRNQVEIVYPIPEYYFIWFGDQFVFEVLRQLGYLTVITPGLHASHYNGGSQNCQRLPEFQFVIDRDKIAWETMGAQEVQNRVSQNQHRRFQES